MKPTFAQTQRTEPISAVDSPLQKRLSAILDDYLSLLEAGTTIDDDRFLATHGDVAEQLRPHLKNLRAMHDAVDSGASQSSASVYEAPKQLGPYILTREIGRGGQGIVYEAQDESLNRRVALKVLPFAALLDRKQIDRFSNEAQAAARLHHPNIVPVFAVGVDRGVHYYAMQFVEGAPLSFAIEQLCTNQQIAMSEAKGSTARPASTRTNRPFSSWILSDAAASVDYCIDANHFQQVARLGIELANGLAHAHELGIVHRDIKPSNLLLDEDGKAWIVDFGLARIPNDTSMTTTGDVLGTIRYMSPEQAKGRNSFVDHRTDIYSLGVTLYELLTLTPVFGSKTREEFMSQVGLQEPTPPRRINSRIPADLENIILRAIEFDPADRYSSASQLSEDLQRYLNGLPTLAKRASASDRVFKWARRHRRLVTTAAIGLVMLAAGLATATLMIAQEQSKTKTALQAIEQEQQKTSVALKEKEAAFERAQANFEKARQIVDQLGVQTSEALAEIPGTQQVRQQLLIDTKRYYDDLLQQSEDEALVHDRGVTLTRSARITEQLGGLREAHLLYKHAAVELQSAIAAHPENDAYRSELLNCWNNEAMLLARMGRLEEAAKKLVGAIKQQQSLLERAAGNPSLVFDLACSQANLAFVFERSQRFNRSQQAYEAAIQLYRQALDNMSTSKQRRQFALVLHNLSALLAHTDHDRAFRLCREAIDIQRDLLNGIGHSIGLKSELAISFDRLAELQLIAGEFQDSETAYQEAIRLQQELIVVSPDDVGLREDLAITLNHLGDLYRDIASYAKAESAFGSAAELLTKMVERVPQEAAFRSSLGAVLYNQGSVLMELDNRDEALRLWNDGLSHQQAAVTNAPTIKRFQTFLKQQETSLHEAFPSQ